MAIIINIDVMLAKRKMSVTELADRVCITIANISILKNGEAKAIRLSTLEAICQALRRQPGEILASSTCLSHGAPLASCQGAVGNPPASTNARKSPVFPGITPAMRPKQLACR
ncbi:helix-turn-helix domain-containing protein [Lacipirellula limnantheis]|uniref:HTH cro/C1-type domain-containing protein n=1 Tax=Lacipirellula limnantheis TaxID=2528024 RepID=A0A517U3A7_9BACT|nr:helix-turn-helix transcriptional regulator [Lacipirellula limnantheis]QDT75093.1 hypothetical protein I41_43020 [Lacipirellula limnantheis]